MYNNQTNIDIFKKATKYLNAKKYQKAMTLFKKAGPNKEALINLGNCYRALNNKVKASECYLEANRTSTPFSDGTFLNTGYSDALTNLGLVASECGATDEAIAFFLEAVKLNKENWLAVWNLANERLRQVSSRKFEYSQTAWDLYESRFRKDPPTIIFNSRSNMKWWDGFSKVKKLIILGEQGIGDRIMMGRYLPLLKNITDAEITIQAPKLIATFFKDYNVVDINKDVDINVGLPIMSLPKVFHGDIPDGKWLANRYIPKIKNGTLDIGIVHSGNIEHENSARRATIPGYFKKLEKYGNLYTLNPTEHGKFGFNSMNNHTWDDTIAAMSKLDLVISVDTSIVHVCGSMGMPCWVLMPSAMTDWRWGDTNMGFDNIWYDSVKVFRNPNSWEDVFKLVEICLRQTYQ
jgi:tetratricopeptide (TPR) repeat protein